MIAIAVDDEPLMLGALVKAVSSSPDIKQVNSFCDCEQATNHRQEPKVPSCHF